MQRLSVRAKTGAWANIPPTATRDNNMFPAFDLADADEIIASEEEAKKENIETISGKQTEST